MASQSSECLICTEEYNSSERAPKFLPSCGHTFCLQCLTRLTSHQFFKHIKCPKCKKVHKLKSHEEASSLTTNYALLESTDTDLSTSRPQEDFEAPHGYEHALMLQLAIGLSVRDSRPSPSVPTARAVFNSGNEGPTDLIPHVQMYHVVAGDTRNTPPVAENFHSGAVACYQGNTQRRLYTPFKLLASCMPDASKVDVYGPGVEHGILATYQGHFNVELGDVGTGELAARISGPTGDVCLEMRYSQEDRSTLCCYNPTEVGRYYIHIKWSGEHVPGSPFNVQIFDTKSQLQRFMQDLLWYY